MTRRDFAERDARRLMDEAIARNGRASAWVRRAQRGALPYNVYASLRTDARVSVVREPLSDVLRRTMPRGGE